METLHAASAGRAAGLDGLRYEHLWQAVGTSALAAAAEDAERATAAHTAPPLAHGLAELFNMILVTPEAMPDSALRLWRAAALSAIGGEAKARPIACSGVMRRLLSSTAARVLRDRLADVLQRYQQFGFGVAAGVEHVAAEVRLWHEVGGTLVLLDSENAFNSLCQLAIALGLLRFCPQLLPLFHAIYCGDTAPELRAELRRVDGASEDGVRILHNNMGCQQGDPLGPLLFSVGLAHALHPAGLPPVAPPHGVAPAAAAAVAADAGVDGGVDGVAAAPAAHPPVAPAGAGGAAGGGAQHAVAGAGGGAGAGPPPPHPPAAPVGAAAGGGGGGGDAPLAAAHGAGAALDGDGAGPAAAGAAPAPPQPPPAPPPPPAGSPPPPNKAFLDDLNLRLRVGFCARNAAAVALMARRMAAVGLRVRADKCLAVALRGRIFSHADRARLAALGIPWVDASAPITERGFTTVGVPIGSAAYVHGKLSAALFAEHVWRLAWQLIGMARSHFQAAFRIFRWSLCQRMGFLARNVDPAVGVAHFGAFDGFCIWVLERVLHLRGAADAATMRAHLLDCCARSDACAAAYGNGADGPLVLPRYSAPAAQWAQGAPPVLPPQLVAAQPALALRVAQLPQRAGGLGLPMLRVQCMSAFIGQLAMTLHPCALRVQMDLPPPVVPAMDVVEGWGAPVPQDPLPPLFLAVRTTVRTLWAALAVRTQPGAAAAPVAIAPDAEPPGPLRRVLSAPLLRWAAGDSVSPTVALAAAAAAGAPLPHNPARGGAPQQLQLPPLPAGGGAAAGAQPAPDDDDDDLADGFLRPQRFLSAHVARLMWRLLVYDLTRLGPAGKPLLAQLRSQSGPGALSWLDVPPGAAAAMTPVAAATMTMVALFVEPWGVTGAACPFHCSGDARPTCVHAVGCPRLTVRGHVATHQVSKLCLQQLLRSCGAPYYLNEYTGAFERAGNRADTVVLPGVLHMCGDAEFERKGVIIDNRVVAPTAAVYCARARGSAEVNGFAAREGEAAKRDRYRAVAEDAGGGGAARPRDFDPGRWVLLPFVQESYGRLGPAARAFIARMAAHSAARVGGSDAVVRRRRGIERRRIVTTLSAALARELAERVLAYVRCARLAGRQVAPVSALLAGTP